MSSKDRYIRSSKHREAAILMVVLITLITVFVVAVLLCVKLRYNLLYVIPFGLVPIIVSSFFDDHTPFFVHIVTVLICSLAAQSSFQAEFIILQFLAGIIAIISVKELTKRTQLVQQMIDLALLSQNILTGEKLSEFVKRSYEIL